MISLNNGITNIANTPGAITDVIANRPANALGGTVFISTDTQEIYSFDGTNWILVTSGGGGPTGWDTMLAQNEAQTANRTANLNTYNWSVNAGINVNDTVLFVAPNNLGQGIDIQLGDTTSNITGNACYFNIHIDKVANDYLINTYGLNGPEGIQLNFVANVYEFGNYGFSTSNNYLKIIGTAGTNQLSTYAWDNNVSNVKNNGLFFDYINNTFYYGGIDTVLQTHFVISAGRIASNFQSTNTGIELNFNNNFYKFGDYNNLTNGVHLLIQDGTQGIQTFWYDTLTSLSYNDGIYLDYATGTFIFGLISTGSGAQFVVSTNEIKSVNNGVDNGYLFNYLTSGGGPFYKFGDFNFVSGAGAGSIVISGGNAETRFNTQTLNFDDNTTGALLQSTSGSVSGQHLKVTINGAPYVIELKNP